jgi:hypothetical protein
MSILLARIKGSTVTKADELERIGQQLKQARTYAAIALAYCNRFEYEKEEDRLNNTEYYARKAFRLVRDNGLIDLLEIL